jgi:glycosyltransferase involved in cell wall biosynthesis
LDRFAPSSTRAQEGISRRRELGIPDAAFVFGFVGRLTVDKGIRELAAAFAQLDGDDPSIWLLIVGEEESQALPQDITTQLSTDRRVRYTGWLPEPSLAYQMIDALVLPTYREGLPNVCLEAAAAAKPVITTTATGAIDSIQDGVTGVLVKAHDAQALLGAMKALASDRPGAIQMGIAGRKFVEAYFGNDIVWANLLQFLRSTHRSSFERAGLRASESSQDLVRRLIDRSLRR